MSYDLNKSMILVKQNEIIVRQGDTGKTMYKIISGRVGVYSGYGEADELLLATLTAQSFFGEMALLNDAPRSATAVALEDTLLLVINEENFALFIVNNPNNAYAIMKNLASMLDNNTRTLKDLSEELSKKDSLTKKELQILNERLKSFYTDSVYNGTKIDIYG